MRVYRNSRLWSRLFCAGLVFAAGCASQATNVPEQNARAQRQSVSPRPEPELPVTDDEEGDPNKPLWWKYGWEDLGKWPRRLVADSKETFLRSDNMTALLLAGGASIIMHNTHADTNIERHFDKHPSLHGFEDESLNILGHPATHVGASTLWYFLSCENDDQINRQRAWTMRTALTVTWAATTGLKLARNNETPNGKSRAWPSGHTSSSFTVASSPRLETIPAGFPSSRCLSVSGKLTTFLNHSKSCASASIFSCGTPAANNAPIIDPADVPAMYDGRSSARDRSALRIPIWAIPLAPPPPKAIPIRFIRSV